MKLASFVASFNVAFASHLHFQSGTYEMAIENQVTPKDSLLKNSLFNDQCQTDPIARVSGKPQAFVVNLDAPPAERWTEVGKAMAEEMHAMKAVLDSVIDTMMVQNVIKTIYEKLPMLVANVNPDYLDEIRGLAEASGMDYPFLLMVNCFYEVGSLGTSIVHRNVDGDIVHGHNLDYGTFLELMAPKNTSTKLYRETTVDITYQRGGNDVFTSTNFAGYVGATAAMGEQFALSVSTRFDMKDRLTEFIAWIMGAGIDLGSIRAFESRELFETCDSFTCAKDSIMNTDFMTPGYFTLSSANEACIISRSHDEVIDVEELTSDTPYLINAPNDKHDLELLFGTKHEKTKECMLGYGDDANAVFNTLSTKPVLNLMTVRSVIMKPGEGSSESFLRECPNLCAPY